MKTKSFIKGDKVNQWTLVTRIKAESRKGHEWLAKCDCGVVGYVHEYTLKYKSAAGCDSCVKASLKSIKHGLSRDRDFNRLQGMINRCYDPSNSSYERYGYRGITVCDRWLYGDGDRSGLECFKSDMGECPDGRTIDRIDNNGPYSPENCRWATAKQQRANQAPRRKWGERKKHLEAMKLPRQPEPIPSYSPQPELLNVLAGVRALASGGAR